ncbi:MAG: hypothetical protein ACI4RI_00195 [Ruminococcus sp.]
MKKKVLKLIALAVFALVAVTALSSCQESKGGKEALTVFDVNSGGVEVTYNNKTVSLDGAEQKEFITIIKEISNAGSIKNNKNINYDMSIDFKNGYDARISTKKKVFLFENEVKEITDKELKSIMEYID